MRKVSVTEFLSLDGVMQGPGAPDEDRSGGFAHGGWHLPYVDEDFMKAATEGMAETGGFLFGRKTYEIMAAHWPSQPDSDPFAAVLNGLPKYVASRTLSEPLEWKGSSLLQGDVPAAVAELRRRGVTASERLPDFPRSACAVVIGGSGGIGRAIALQLAERGCDIALNYFSNVGGAEETAARIRRAGREVHVGQVDLRDEALVKQFVDEAGQHFGGVHTAIYAAGPYIPMRFVSQQPAATFREVMEHATMPALAMKVPLHVDARAARNWEEAH